MNTDEKDTLAGCDRRRFLKVGSALVTAAPGAGAAGAQTSEKQNDIER